MKEIKLTPEWILDKLTDAAMVTEDGEVILTVTDNTASTHFVELALQTAEIGYQRYEFDEEYGCVVEYTFLIKDLKEDCPNLYEKWNEVYIEKALAKK